MMKILDLVVKHKWYDMEESGEKPEEYREIKPYWFDRLIDCRMTKDANLATEYFGYDGKDTNLRCIKKDFDRGYLRFKNYTHVRFHRGYTSTTMLFEIKSMHIGFGNPSWGAPEEEVFIIKLGERV